MNKFISIVLILSFLVTYCNEEDKNDTKTKNLHTYLIEKDRFLLYKNTMLIKRGDYDAYLFHNNEYNIDYWYRISGKEIIFEEDSKQKSDSILSENFPSVSESIKVLIYKAINESIKLIHYYGVKSVHSIMYNDSLSSISFEIENGKSLEYWERISKDELSNLKKDRVIIQLDEQWFIVKNKFNNRR